MRARTSVDEIVENSNLKKSKVEHWFRTDQFWAVPDEDSWFELKALLQITTTDFDSCITEFEYRNGVYDKSERIYLTDFIAPCLTTESATEKFLVRKA
jgi:DNA (cytosine-5)-methyltransferase 1